MDLGSDFASKREMCNMMKALKISKMLLMAFLAPMIFLIIYIWSLRFKEFVPPFFCFLFISLFVLAPLEIFTLLRENKKENGKLELSVHWHIIRN